MYRGCQTRHYHLRRSFLDISYFARLGVLSIDIEWQIYDIRDTYPHLLPSDNALWREFVLTHPGLYDSVAYDVRVGEGEPVPPDYPPELVRMWYMLTTRRIDVVGRIGSSLDIIEVKPFAGLSCIGQLLSYQFLFRGTYPDLSVPDMVAITNLEFRDILTCFSHFGIRHHIIPIFEF